jgi:hypothetical protein
MGIWERSVSALVENVLDIGVRSERAAKLFGRSHGEILCDFSPLRFTVNCHPINCIKTLPFDIPWLTKRFSHITDVMYIYLITRSRLS